MLIPNAQQPITCHFLSVIRQYHHPKSPNKDVGKDYAHQEKIFLNFFQIGLFETYHFLYNECNDDEHFAAWIIQLKGAGFYRQAAIRFNEWLGTNHVADAPFEGILNETQHQFWKENGYLKIDKIIDAKRCNAVIDLIMETLGVDMDKPETWYANHKLLQGLMLQLYQHEALDVIRHDDQVKSVFASLYGTDALLPNCEKVSFNPPVNKNYTFKGSPLHWDIDFNIGPKYYIQGLLYLNDVPVNRGPFSLIPGYHLQIEAELQHKSPELLIQQLTDENLAVPITGEQGDLVLWLQALPHAASPNLDDVPRFVQYLSFNQI
ncbi:phytanoyl-CoA dioxygenase family protein [Pedobacter miscanthi]|uniref:phytanoyl-CoA dioxygenase family protein n=1 Tax=Pedobacter miscanthi TaxID=2259170 RepID=UPI00292F6BF7|nr:phytanoyl-CoA dioxygenase family protein [Pedobacter miscanthi]